MSLDRLGTSLHSFAPRALIALVVATASGCAVAASLEPDDGPARIVLEEVGGIAGRSIMTTVDSATRVYVSYDRSRCPQPTNCPAPFSKTGTLTSAAIVALFERAASPAFLQLSREYGRTPNSADMIDYSLTVAASKRAKKITADDGTMPQPMQALVNEVKAVIAGQ